MGRASADFSTSGHETPSRRRRRGVRLRSRRHRSPTPTSIDATSQELVPSSAASDSQQLSYLPYAEDDTGAHVAVVAPLPIFRGDPGECPDAHLARFDRIRRANGAVTPEAAARIFPASLDADAGLWYDEITASGDEAEASPHPPPPWDAVRAAFLDFFRPSGAADRARAELVTMKQGPGEAVSRYHLRMRGILRRCPDAGADISDAFLKTAFVDGLRSEFQDLVVAQQPEALDEAVALALSWERAEGLREARRVAKAACSAGDRCSFCDAEGHEEARCEVRMRMRQLYRGSSSGGRGGAIVAVKEEEQAEEGGGSMALARLGSAVSTRSEQCRCRKHQCNKKAVAPSVVGGGDANCEAADK